MGADAELPNGFIGPFKSTAAYLDMYFWDYFYAATSNLNQPERLLSLSKTFVANLK